MQPPIDPANDSDSDNDPDYVPPADEPSDDERQHKRAKTDADEAETAVDDEKIKKRKREALWADFQASLSAPAASSQTAEPRKMVKVEKRYRFAGEEVVEVVDVPEDSEDAKKWPLWKPTSEEKISSDVAQPIEAPLVKDDAKTMPMATSTEKKAAKRPGPRKPKTQLAPLPGAQKAKKLTTLDKSAMDWRSHVDSTATPSGLKDELQANRRGGGYLEKVEFLSRVEERREEALEASKSTKRRRP